MTAAAWTTFAVVAGFVWGGFLLLLVVAMRKERGKRDGETGSVRVP
ncbi:MAG: hypothetical protein KY397_01585 [Gemmatimonadetes bacterium]|nr:hypothetical protein [Gemmatimonadota bacterium]